VNFLSSSQQQESALPILPSHPAILKDSIIAPILCGGVMICKALTICGAVPGQWVAINSASGGVGALGVQYARAMGYRVVAIDGGAVKGSYCASLRAEVYIDFSM
jgi:propanol-preferring alcohol dehydrogenase